MQIKGLNQAQKFVQSVEKKIDNVLATAPKAIAMEIRDELESATPVYTGHLANMWKIADVRKGHARVTNPVYYARYIEFGSELHSHPWPSPGLRTSMMGGRVWSTQAIGGVTQNITSGMVDNLVKVHVRDKL
jgi:hypothetical protein